ncbi:hypothetical protein [Clostridium beijerinckii]|nr:hypothetical protein [Clostridium beijerinckii]NRT75531.1 adenylate kinase family enzyme [Clostridium beijerinckii]OOM35894.1 cytidylate kinase [Clostridium beijerinckii]
MYIKKVNKITIIGSPGSGKTTLAERFSQMYDLSVLNLDEVHWKDTWIKNNDEVILNTIDIFLKKNNWIIEGNYKNFLLNRRLEEATLIIFLDFNTFISFYRVLRRYIYFIFYPYNKNPISNKINFKFILNIIFKQKYRSIELHKFISPYLYKTIIIKNQNKLNSYLKQIGVNYE